MARIGVAKGASSLTPAPTPSMGGTYSGQCCSLCGQYGHAASLHKDGQAVSGGPVGPAIEQNKATQWSFNESDTNVGSDDYQLPGERGEKSIRIFG